MFTKSLFLISNSPYKLFFLSLWAWCSLDAGVIFEIQVLDESHKELLLNFFVPIFWFPYQLLLQTVFSEMHFPFERQIQLSVPGIYGDFDCSTKFAHFLNRDLFSLWTQILQHVQQNCCLAPVHRCCGLKLNSTTLEPCLLPNAGCCLLRIGEEDGQNPRRLRQCSSGRSPGWRTFLESSLSHFQPST